MRVGIATVYTPGINGGAEYLAQGLSQAILNAGHSLHHVRMPFQFDPPDAAIATMKTAAALDFRDYGGGQIDHLICLKFPAYLIEHPSKSIWLLHQHRSAYDLYGGPYGWSITPENDARRETVLDADRSSLSDGRPIYTIANRVSQRLRTYCGLESRALYHPPANEKEFHCRTALPYIFAPSRMETLKRQDLLLQAVSRCSNPVQIIFCGTGSQRAELERLSEELGLTDRVRFLGEVPRSEMIELYANALAVYFGPLDEDYGYVTLEAMLSSKPVITCLDSGGPLEFVVDDVTGLVCRPFPEDIAEALDSVWDNRDHAARMGKAGRARYDQADMSWSHVVHTLLPEHS